MIDVSNVTKRDTGNSQHIQAKQLSLEQVQVSITSYRNKYRSSSSSSSRSSSPSSSSHHKHKKHKKKKYPTCYKEDTANIQKNQEKNTNVPPLPKIIHHHPHPTPKNEKRLTNIKNDSTHSHITAHPLKQKSYNQSFIHSSHIHSETKYISPLKNEIHYTPID